MDELGAVGESRLVPGTLFFSLVFFLRECRFAVVEWVTGLALPGLDSPKHKVLAPGLLGGGGNNVRIKRKINGVVLLVLTNTTAYTVVAQRTM